MLFRSEEDSDDSEPKKVSRKQSNVSNGKKGKKAEDEEMGGEGEEEKKELFVKNLSFNIDEDALNEAFGKFGEISNIKMLRLPDGRPKGIAFIEFANGKEAQKAINALNN